MKLANSHKSLYNHSFNLIDMRDNMTDIANELKTIRDYIRWTAGQLIAHDCFQGHGTTTPIDDACHLVLTTLQLNPNDDLGDMLDARLTLTERQLILSLVEKRTHEKIPTAYLTKTAWFADMPFYVDERVIIPRSPIAELIINRFSPWLEQTVEPERILDLCTGSGCLAILSSYYFPETPIDAVDISHEALEVTNINIKKHSSEGQVAAIESDLFFDLADRRYAVIICNPPYVSDEEIDELPDEYHHEPEAALHGGDVDGLEIVSDILRQARDYLTDDGILVMEVGYSKDLLEARYPNVPFTWVDLENGGEGVFIFTANELEKYQAAFAELVH